MNSNFSVHPNNVSSLTLFGLSLANYILMYWANIFLARHMSIGEFDDYNVAVSVVTLLSTLATLGLEKYALRLVALNIERQKWGRLRNFLRFSLLTIFFFSLILLAVLSLTLEGVLLLRHADSHIAIVIYAAFLPAIAISLFLIEIITVYGYQIAAIALYRLFLPVMLVVLLLAVQRYGFDVSAVSAAICLGLAWCLTLIMLGITTQFCSPLPQSIKKSKSQNPRKWLSNAFPLLVTSLMMTVLTSAGTIVLELLYPSSFEVGLFSVVMQTCALVSLIGTSTNRYYLPMLVVLIERREGIAAKALLNKRLRLIGSIIMLYWLLVGTQGGEILALFGADFREGFIPLCICALGAGINALFSEAPYYLQFMGRNRLVVGLTSLTALCMLGFSFGLGRLYGATGVAIAYALPTGLLYVLLKWLANRHLRQYLATNVQA